MPQTDTRRVAAWVAAGVILALLAAGYLARSRPTADAAAQPAVATIAAAGQAPPAGAGGAPVKGAPVIVDVSGAVKRPGVYRLTTQDRVEDALERVGGATRRADLAAINRASKLEDGRQILVPTRGKAAAVTAPPGGSGGSGVAPSAGPVNLNSATPEQLETLDGVGPATARKIIEYREQHGGFKSVEELDQVSGIGEKRLAAIRDHVAV
jgi:competence protein ComEA